MGTAVFQARGLTKTYRMGEVTVAALRAVDLELVRGEIVVILGPSGSGKSTLLNLLGGLDTPTAGEVHFLDHDLTTDDDRALTRFRREHVGFVFQFYNLIPSLTARENVALVTEIADHPMAPEEALSLVGLGDRLDHFPSQLSGGEQQRVAIARAIAKRPDVLLCDEPTGALDFETGVLVLDALLAVNRAIGTTTNIQAAALMFGGHQLVRAGQLGRAQLFLDSLKARAALRPYRNQEREALAILSADLDLARGKPARADSALATITFDDYTTLGMSLKAEIHAANGARDSALAYARRATESPSFGLEIQQDWFRSMSQLARIAESVGDEATARSGYSQLIERWQRGDPDLPPLVLARRELVRLQSATQR
ncbi:MAG: ABC transporter ATP-binding protein [Gemmatimonadetes bacterium]|nr:ABC transporter ATP-binding protein [Gemmatimonadota bacterium]